ncbi:MFS transporter [Marinobacter lutaoensis]|uniref:MFS transporter n=1 Tax=Marinobacter lutaoensis TaxID=135739 RepID=A0A1V2DRX1_9GAMM|nr:MFS transporter [Marinobacter lutaoensis]ONF43428.1 MFS transporter [Marinobacter lutaoensis]
MNTVEISKKVAWRLLPFLLLMYVMAFLDRANVGFAKEAFQADTGISNAAFAFGAGIFFLGYALFEVPSNLIMQRVGAKIWMCRIMVTWGMLSAAMMFADSETLFYLLRFMLGVAEAGFFPGVILYLTYWFPSQYRAKAMGFFYFGAPIAFILGGPLSGFLLELHGAGGLLGWQWMFLVEGLLASIVGVWAYFYLDNGPKDAQWLSDSERNQLIAALDAENRDKVGHEGHGSLLKAMRDMRTLHLALIYALIQCSVYGMVFYLPTQVGALVGDSVGLVVGLFTAIPWICALLAAYFIPAFSDRTGERRKTAAVTILISGCGIALSVALSTPAIAFIALCFAAAGFIAVQPVFWTFPSAYLTGSAAAAGIALINTIGAIGAFLAPNLKNWAETTYASNSAGLYLLASLTVVAALLLLAIRRSDSADYAAAKTHLS